ncbi:MAG: hypothetical protein CVU56_02795 [Deltaproteobacteria bacterium HGW-Deltaproteobacteria-14]|nr:MAG: hypothetical protein CVU56_02795 [Deltaproteobacteria bacterium HGW-Deltaproteobacteria-14]
MGSSRRVVIASGLGFWLAVAGCFPAVDGQEDVLADTAAADTAALEETASPRDTGGNDDTTVSPDTALPIDTAEQEDTLAPVDTATPDDTVAPADTQIVADTVAAPAPPSGVSASTERAADIDVSWLESAGATGYRVYRCELDDCAPESAWDLLTVDPIGGTHLLDADVEAPGPPGAPTGLGASTDDPDEVLVTWAPVIAPLAPRYRYRVVAVGPVGESAPSEAAIGHRAERPVTGYEIRVDDGGWSEVSGSAGAAWHDTAAAPPSLVAGEATASKGTFAGYVRLTVAGSAPVAGAEHSYRVRAVTDYGPADSSVAVVGWRSPGALSFRWERSVDTSPEGFAALPGANGTTFDDTGAPADGSVRWYRVVVSADGAADAETAAVSGARQPPPGVPGGVAASDSLEAYVLVSWEAVPGALGYHVYRDGTKLTTGGAITGTSYQDLTAGPVEGSWLAPTGLAASTNDYDVVNLTWTAPGRPLGNKAPYQVQAVNAAGDGPLSAAALGRRAAPALTGFEVEVRPSGGSATWYTTGSTLAAWTHADPPKATINGGTVSVGQGDHRAFVRLVSSGASVGQAPSVTYRVRGLLADGTQTPISLSNSGRRAVGTLSRQWQRSTSTSSTSFFGGLVGATGASFDDPGAPSDGSKRWYRLSLSAPGADSRAVGTTEGWRLAFVQVDGGEEHTCAVTNDGQVWCWGVGEYGQLGRGVFEGADPLSPGRVPNLGGVIQVHAGRYMTCARTAAGQTWCWGGEHLGNGQVGWSASPLQIPALTGATSIAIGEFHACATLATGGIKCWGAGDGRLGTNSWEPALFPASVRTSAGSLLSDLGAGYQVSTSWAHTCGRLNSGEMWCWGSDGCACGALGADPGSFDYFGTALVAVRVSLSATAEIAVAATYSCARHSSGAISCWGDASRGGLGDGTTSNAGWAPVTVSAITTAVELSASWLSTCARLANGTVRCWGGNESGQLGTGSAADYSATPGTVGPGLTAVTSLGSGNSHHCAIQGGDVYCWGANWGGQLGAAAASQDQYGHPYSTVPLKTVLP